LFNILCEERGGIKMNIKSSLVLPGMILAMHVYAEEYINDGLSSQVTTYTLAANADSDGIDKSNMDKSNVDTSNMDEDNMDTSNMDTGRDESDMDTSNMDTGRDESDMDTSNMD
jgi:hypothetical protein